MDVLSPSTPLHLAPFDEFFEDGITCFIDAGAPNWIAVEETGAEIVRKISAAASARVPLSFGALVADHARSRNLEAGKAWGEIHDFFRALGPAGGLFYRPVHRPPYPGPASLIP